MTEARTARSPQSGSRAASFLSVLRTLRVAVFVCVVPMVVLGLGAALPLVGALLHGPDDGALGDVGALVAGTLLVMLAGGEMLILLLARWIVWRIERETKRIEEWRQAP